MFQQQQMKIKISVCFWLLVLIIESSSATIKCRGLDCLAFGTSVGKQPVTEQEARILCDRETRRIHWYFLRGAELIYNTNMDSPKKYTFFFMYRNVVGTFISITSWEKLSRKPVINTIIRLGKGQSFQEGELSPMVVDPFLLTFRLEEGEHKITRDQNGKFTVDAEFIDDKIGQLSQMEIEHKAIITDHFLRMTYWFFIHDANLASTHTILTSQKIHILMTYVSGTGTYFLICNINSRNFITVDSFIRLGDTLDQDNQDLPVVRIDPVVFVLR